MKNCYIRSKSTKRPHVSTVAAQRCQAPTHYAYFRPSWPAGSAAASGDGTLGCRLVSRSTSTSANCVVSLITTQARACGTRCSWLVNHVVCLRLDCIPQRIQDVHAGAHADGGEVLARLMLLCSLFHFHNIAKLSFRRWAASCLSATSPSRPAPAPPSPHPGVEGRMTMSPGSSMFDA